ncbi:MAG TPA: D-2-hydroxyacid dehydrogenase [Candidatus Methylacidiphilales bacterium]|nr:D-2-hydroxyacid dehydrogenase [Candidatus Methylacidiphilales bacterium]
MTRPLRIFADIRCDSATEEKLRIGVSPHELIRPTESISVLSSINASLTGVDIAFGQPGVAGVLASDTLRWVHVSSAGYTRYDTPEFRAAAQSRGLALTNSSSVYDEPCAEHVLAFMLGAARQLPRGLHSRAASGTPDWNGLRSACRLLRGESLLILGYGAIARHLVRLLAPFHMRIVALRRRPSGDEEVPIISFEELPAALAKADHVLNILPDNAQTRGFLNEERLAQIKPGALLYNIGRGTTVDQPALVQALRSGQIAQAWLDVTDPEPLPPGHPLLALENCHITPHIAGGHQNESQSLVDHFLQNFRRYVEGSSLNDRVL